MANLGDIIAGNIAVIAQLVIAFLGGTIVPLCIYFLHRRRPTDKEIFQAWKQTFSRFAFRGPYYFQSSPGPFKRSIEEITKEIQSGVPNTPGSLGMNYLRSKKLREEMEKVMTLLQQLNFIAGKLVDQGDVGEDEQKRLDDARTEIIDIMNPIWQQFKLGKIRRPKEWPSYESAQYDLAQGEN